MQDAFEIAARIHYLVSIPSTSKCISACTAHPPKSTTLLVSAHSLVPVHRTLADAG